VQLKETNFFDPEQKAAEEIPIYI